MFWLQLQQVSLFQMQNLSSLPLPTMRLLHKGRDCPLEAPLSPAASINPSFAFSKGNPQSYSFQACCEPPPAAGQNTFPICLLKFKVAGSQPRLPDYPIAECCVAQGQMPRDLCAYQAWGSKYCKLS